MKQFSSANKPVFPVLEMNLYQYSFRKDTQPKVRSRPALLAGLMVFAFFLATACAGFERRTLPPRPVPVPAQQQAEDKEALKDDEPSESSDTPRTTSTSETVQISGSYANRIVPPSPQTVRSPEISSQQTQLDKLRVLLFENQPASSYQIRSVRGEIRIRDEQSRRIIRLQPNGDTARFTARHGSAEVMLQTGGASYTATRWITEAENGAVTRIEHPAAGWRTYMGNFDISSRENRLYTLNTIGLEDYVASVVGGEMNFNNAEALKVQAVISRTYALWNSYLSRNAGNEYDLSDHVMNQVYIGENLQVPRFREAAEATSGYVLSWSGALILAAFHSTCGGQTSPNESVWSGNALPYLRGVSDRGSCSASPHFRWNFTVEKSELHRLFGIEDITGLKNDNGGRAGTILVIRDGKTDEIQANQFRLRFNQTYGTMALRSTFFEMSKENNSYIFKGKGMGHGLGLCQWGALGLAEAGWSYGDILRFYYNGADKIQASELHRGVFRLARF
ncbi:MAG: SpoIID/LytB domain-containing protein [Balneolales bacterium]|nr:SpoIID/LytB domain-containing protein [Balneolales bacterium]